MNPGDIVGASGALRLTKTSILMYGMMAVTPRQAALAAPYGWQRVGMQGDMIKVMRNA